MFTNLLRPFFGHPAHFEVGKCFSFFSASNPAILWRDSTAFLNRWVGLHIFTRTSFLSCSLRFSLLWFYENCCPLMRYTLLYSFSGSLLIWLQNPQDCPNTQIFPPLLKAFCTILFPCFAIFSPPFIRSDNKTKWKLTAQFLTVKCLQKTRWGSFCSLVAHWNSGLSLLP